MKDTINVTMRVAMPPEGIERAREGWAVFTEGFECKTLVYEFGGGVEMVADFGDDPAEAALFASMLCEISGRKPTVVKMPPVS
jgi:hypothetical protein